jgi:hypothetical protein
MLPLNLPSELHCEFALRVVYFILRQFSCELSCVLFRELSCAFCGELSSDQYCEFCFVIYRVSYHLIDLLNFLVNGSRGFSYVFLRCFS